MEATKTELELLESLYEGRKPVYGEVHDHSSCGDGKYPLMHWRGAMQALRIDFAAILDHRQVEHMYHPDWEDGVFLGGTEPGTKISDSKAEVAQMHYNMIFEGPRPLEELLEAFPEFEFTGAPDGRFNYPKFTTARMQELIAYIQSHGGVFVHPHPKQLMRSEDPLDYWFADGTGIEIVTNGIESQQTRDNYALYQALLAKGKRVWGFAGGDYHACATDSSISTIYAREKKNAAYLEALCVGDFTAGGVGIRMCVGETRMGGSTAFVGKQLIVSAGDFHRSVGNPEHRYLLEVHSDRGVEASVEFSCPEGTTLSLPAEDRDFYRTTVTDINRNLILAYGNPIWNDR